MTTVTTATTPKALQLRNVLDGTFRANPGYELRAFDQLPTEQQEFFAALQNDSELYGVLAAREGARLPLKSACNQTARLFHALQTPARLPAFAVTGLAEEANQSIVGLVLDGILEIFHEGEMLHGAAAVAAVSNRAVSSAQPTGTAALSRDAILYAQSLPFTEATALSARLYSYGRIPATAVWRRRFPDEAALRTCLGLATGGRNANRVAARWQSLPADPDNDGWLFWRSTKSSAGRTAAYKLYLSPQPAFIGEAFDALIPALEAARANAFKIGKDYSGLLRADKIIAYFSHFEQLHHAAYLILDNLAGCPAHGVPFTAQIETPLVSWGADPLTDRDLPPWLARQSWRLWITNRLAVALLAAKQQPAAAVEPWQFALDRLSLEGVDTNNWSPLRKEGN